jgi:hypothetical protein
MITPSQRRLLESVLAYQEETGEAARITPARLAELAAEIVSGKSVPREEQEVLIRSPLARQELALLIRICHTARAEALTGSV